MCWFAASGMREDVRQSGGAGLGEMNVNSGGHHIAAERVSSFQAQSHCHKGKGSASESGSLDQSKPSMNAGSILLVFPQSSRPGARKEWQAKRKDVLMQSHCPPSNLALDAIQRALTCRHPHAAASILALVFPLLLPSKLVLNPVRDTAIALHVTRAGCIPSIRDSIRLRGAIGPCIAVPCVSAATVLLRHVCALVQPATRPEAPSRHAHGREALLVQRGLREDIHKKGRAQTASGALPRPSIASCHSHTVWQLVKRCGIDDGA